MEIKKLENSAVRLTITLKAEEIEAAYKKTIQDYSKKIVMKGFRQGKAPVSLIENKYGKDIREESTLKLMEENLEKSYKDMDVKDRPLPYSTPELQDEDSLFPLKPNTDITYSVVYDVVPEVKLPAYKGLEVEAKEDKVSAKDIDDEIEKLRQQNAMIVAKNGKIAEGDIVTMDYAELDADGKDVANTKRDDFTFTVGSSYNFYQLDKDIVGLKKGDKKVITKTYGDDSGMGTDYLGKTVNVRVEIKEVKYKDVPELDDDFAQDIKDEYKTVADLKAATKKQLEDKIKERNNDYKLDAILKSLADKTKIAIPKSMIDAQLEQEWKGFVQRFGMSEEEVAKLMSANGGSKEQFLDTRKADVAETLKVQLILEQIKEEQKFTVTDDEIQAELAKYGSEITKDNPNYDAFKMYAEDDIKFSKAKDYLVANNKFKALVEKAEKKAAAKKTADKTEKAETKKPAAKSTASKTAASKTTAAKKTTTKSADKPAAKKTTKKTEEKK